MKKLFILSITLMSAAISIGQITVIEKAMSQGTNESIEISIEGVPLKTAQNEWMKFVKQYKGKTKFDKVTQEYFTDNAKMEALSSNTVDAYATIVEFKGENKVVATFWFDLGGSFLNPEQNPERIESAQNMIQAYVKNVRVVAAEDEYSEQIRIMKSLKNDLQSLIKANAKFHEKIAEAEKLIAEMKANIVTNDSDQKNKHTEIKGQQAVVNEAQAKIARIKS